MSNRRSWSVLIWVAVLPLLLDGCGGGPVRDKEALRQEIVRAAINQVGTPYRFGGASPAEGFDCSGLVRYTHDRVGIPVPRVVADQLNKARSVGSNQARPGDLVFFKLSPSDYHVGILVESDRFIHAPRSGKDVRFDTLDAPYWASRFVGAGSFL